MLTPNQELPPLPEVGRPESYYAREVHRADKRGDVHTRESFKVAQYITLAMDAFYRALLLTEHREGVTRIVHYGDSPTTADLIAGDVRALLQARYGRNGTLDGSALDTAFDNGVDALRVLADRGADLNVQDPEGTTT
jgi:hypothetical protein